MFQIKWTSKAAKEKADALKFWIEKNKSNTYSRKIHLQSKKSLILLKANPYIGQELFDFEGIRCIVILRKFSIFYRIVDHSIEILSFWDGHRNPDNIKI